jgi:hypothetical protein
MLWDYAAGRLILEEAGGSYSTLGGTPLTAGPAIKRSVIAAASPALRAMAHLAARPLLRAYRSLSGAFIAITNPGPGSRDGVLLEQAIPRALLQNTHFRKPPCP